MYKQYNMFWTTVGWIELPGWKWVPLRPCYWLRLMWPWLSTVPYRDVSTNHIKATYDFFPFISQRQIDQNVNFEAWDVRSGAHLIIVDSEVGLLAPQVPLYDCPTFKTYKQL